MFWFFYFISIILNFLWMIISIKKNNKALEEKQFYMLVTFAGFMPYVNNVIGGVCLILIGGFLLELLVYFISNKLSGIFEKIIIYLNKNVDRYKEIQVNQFGYRLPITKMELLATEEYKQLLTDSEKLKLIKKMLITSGQFKNNKEIEVAINSMDVANKLIGE